MLNAECRPLIEGEGAGDNWAEYNHRLAQAEADARTFSEARKQAEKFHEVMKGLLQIFPPDVQWHKRNTQHLGAHHK